jgi:hypothetical protein
MVGYFSELATKNSLQIRDEAIMWNPFDNTGVTLSNNNLTVRGSAMGWWGAKANLTALYTGKWYAEFSVFHASTNQTGYGVTNNLVDVTNLTFYSPNFPKAVVYLSGSTPRIYNNESYTAEVNYTTGDIMGLALDCDAKTVTFYKNNILVKTVSFSFNPPYTILGVVMDTGNYLTANFCGSGATPFKYTPPYGYLAYDNLESLISKYSGFGVVNPHGYFKLYKVGTDYLGRSIMIADRNLQNNISWDTLNKSALVYGIDPTILGKYPVIPLMTGYSAPSPIVITDTGCYSTYYGWRAFDWNDTTDFQYYVGGSGSNVADIVINVDLGYPAYADSIRVVATTSGYQVMSLKLWGSNNPNAFGYDDYVKSLNHFDGLDDSTSFTDVSGKEWTPVGTGGKLKISNRRFGISSLYLDGNSYFTTPNNSDFDFGSGSFTVDWWEYRINSANQYCLLARDINIYPPFIFGHSDGTNVTVLMTSNRSSWDIALNKSMGTIKLDQWVHRAIVRNGNNYYTFENGAVVSSWSNSSALASSGLPISIGYNYNYYFQGYVDELRVSKGVARWIANFTPQKEPYSSFTLLKTFTQGSPVISWEDTFTGGFYRYYRFSHFVLYTRVLDAIIYTLQLYNNSIGIMPSAGFYNIFTRLLTGGVDSTNLYSEWDTYVVESTLNNKIAAGDIYTWNTEYTLTMSWMLNAGTALANRVTRGSGANISDYTPQPTTTVDGVRGYRPVMLIGVNSTPITDTLQVDSISTHGTNINLTGNLIDTLGEQASYRISLNSTVKIDWTSNSPVPVAVSYVVLASDLNMGINDLLVEYKDNISPQSSGSHQFTLTKLNYAPTDTLQVDRISTHTTTVVVSGNITDPDGDQVKYRIKLNGDVIQDYGSLANSPLAVNYNLLASALNIGGNNLLIEYEDSYGGGGSHQFTITKTNVAPTDNLQTDRVSRHTQTVRVYGDITDSEGDTVRYRILLNSNVHLDWSSLANSPVSVDHTFSALELGNAEATIRVEYEDSYGASSAFQQIVAFTDSLPVISVSASTLGTYVNNVVMSGNITEADGDNVRYKIEINSSVVKDWTSFASTPVSIYETYIPTNFIEGVNTLKIYAEDNITGASTATYYIVKRDWGITFVNSLDDTENYFGYEYVSLSQVHTALVDVGLYNPNAGYLKKVTLTLEMLVQASGNVKIAKILSSWNEDTVTYLTKPDIDTDNAITVAFTLTPTQNIDITALFGNYGVALYTTSGSFTLDYLDNYTTIDLTPTIISQPLEVLGDRVVFAWEEIKSLKVVSWISLIRSESNLFTNPTILFQSAEGLVDFEDDTVQFNKNYFYKIQVRYDDTTTEDSDYVAITTPNDLLHKYVWNGSSYDLHFIEGLMFHDDVPEYYSTSRGLILKFLELPLLYAGQQTDVYKITLENTFDTTVTDVLLEADLSLPDGCSVKFSLVESPFEDLNNLPFTSIAPYEEIDFYIKMYSQAISVGEGSFDIRVKGTV